METILLVKRHFLGKNINFDFEVDKKAFVWYHSCGAWLNGEYFIISGLHDGPDESEFGPIIRNDEEFLFLNKNNCEFSTSKVKSMDAH